MSQLSAHIQSRFLKPAILDNNMPLKNTFLNPFTIASTPPVLQFKPYLDMPLQYHIDKKSTSLHNHLHQPVAMPFLAKNLENQSFKPNLAAISADNPYKSPQITPPKNLQASFLPTSLYEREATPFISQGNNRPQTSPITIDVNNHFGDVLPQGNIDAVLKELTHQLQDAILQGTEGLYL